MASCAASGPGASWPGEALAIFLLAEPPSLLDQVPLHEADQRDGPAEAGGAEPEEVAREKGERRPCHRMDSSRDSSS